MMKRRAFITLLGGTAAAWPLAGRAQQAAQPRRIAVLMGTATSELGKSYLATFVQRLDQLGWINGGNARIETRWWTGTVDQMRPVVAELLAFSPDVIMNYVTGPPSETASDLGDFHCRHGEAPRFAGKGREIYPWATPGWDDTSFSGRVGSAGHPGGAISGRPKRRCAYSRGVAD
jgi:hypothetical protein